MAELIVPTSVEELRDAVLQCGRTETRLETGGAFSKRLYGGPASSAGCRIETSKLNRLLAYEPADLTVSVEAGMPIAELSRILARNNQVLPLDPPFAETATVGGVLAANASGSRRRRFGTARDMTIGIRFVTLEGKLISSGGMVVKNVTGLDMSKLMIGSFGTLAVIVSANFKVFPTPESTVSFLFQSAVAESLLRVRSQILTGQLQPIAIDWLDPRAADAMGLQPAHALVVEAAGNAAVTDRFSAFFKELARTAGVSSDSVSQNVWSRVRECGPQWLARHPEGALIMVSTVHRRLGALLELADAAGCAAALRAGNATGILMAPDASVAKGALSKLRADSFHATLEAGADGIKRDLEQWTPRSSELLLMQRIKADFDPLMLLNRGRLYGIL